MEYFILPAVALIVALLTFFSGFGLGTVLLPVFTIFFPIPIAITMTAIIHFFNNFFKFYLVGKNTNWKIVITFGMPALLAAFIGAAVFVSLSQISFIGRYELFGKVHLIEPLKLILGVLLLIFVTLELKTESLNLQLKKKHLIIGGLLSGFFGGLSGFQGVFRSMFLINCNLTKEEFIASGVVISCLVDLARIPIYSFSSYGVLIKNNFLLLLITMIAAFIGAYLGNIFLKKTTIQLLKIIIAIFIYVISIFLIMGFIA
jgi:hypothetical protein